MFISKLAIPRRTFLRGAGAALALPLLDAMVPAATALAATDARRPMRMGFMYIPHGADMPSWTPAAAGPNFELSPARFRLLTTTRLSLSGSRPFSVGDSAKFG